MSYAPNYTPGTSFADDETNNVAGRSLVKTDSLDAELADISASINALNTNQKTLQRDDGKLADNLVEPYALAEQTRALIATNGSKPRGTWAPNTDYYFKEVVQRDNVAQMCLQDHNSGSTFTQSFWLPISGDGTSAANAAAAAASASAAATSQTAAAASATAAAGSSTSASTSATNAATSATNASNSAASASTSATNAANSATESAASAASAAASAASIPKIPSVRQTVLSGPVDSNGFPSFGGSTGGTTVTVSGTLRVTSSNGEDDNVLDVVNPSWTGLNTNGTLYLWIDTVTGATGASTLAPNYQFGGAYSTTSGQHTYNTQEAVMKVGDGTVANQVNRVFVGECLVASNVVSTITWYALKGKYRSALTAIPSASARTVFNTNIGVSPQIVRAFARCKSATGGYAVGEYAQASTFRDDGSYGYAYNPVVPESRNVVSFITGNNSSFAVMVQSKSSPGSNIQATSANWDLLLEAERGF